MVNNVFFIIPAYNAEKTLERSVKSALNQKNIIPYIIIVNHGSTDKTEQISKKLKKEFPSISFLLLKRRPEDLRSPSIPLNYAYTYLNTQNKISSTNWFMRLDADDFLLDENSIHKILFEKEKYKMVCAKLIFFDTKACKAYIYGPKKKYQSKQGMLTKGAYAGAHHATLVRGDLLKRLDDFPKPYNELVSYGEDLDFTLMLFSKVQEEEYNFSEDPILLKSLHEDSITSLTPRIEIMMSMKKIFNKYTQLSRLLLLFLFFDLFLRRKNWFLSFLRNIFGFPAHKVAKIKYIEWKKFIHEYLSLQKI